MNRLTLGQARNNRAIYKLIENGTCPTSQVAADRINEAQERLLAKGKWPGLKQKYSFCAYDGCITLPMELESILAVAVDCNTVHIFSQWYEFIESGVGLQGNCGCGLTEESECTNCGVNSPIDQGSFPTFRDLCGEKYIRVYCDINEDADAEILIRGFDENGNKVMTYHDGGWIDGEYISLAPTYPNVSTKKFTVITSVVKPVTIGYVRIYQYDATMAAESCIAIYAPNETLPIYRRYKIPALNGRAADDPATVTILAKRRYVPAVNDNDDLLITNIAALKNMIISIIKEENGEGDASEGFENRAARFLNEELRNYSGGENARRMSFIDLSPTRNVM